MHRLTRALRRMLRPFTVLSPVVNTGVSPSRSNQIGAAWGLPSARTVARTAVLARSSMKLLYSSFVICYATGILHRLARSG
jgi:hypothetical protein